MMRLCWCLSLVTPPHLPQGDTSSVCSSCIRVARQAWLYSSKAILSPEQVWEPGPPLLNTKPLPYPQTQRPQELLSALRACHCQWYILILWSSNLLLSYWLFAAWVINYQPVLWFLKCSQRLLRLTLFHQLNNPSHHFSSEGERMLLIQISLPFLLVMASGSQISL